MQKLQTNLALFLAAGFLAGCQQQQKVEQGAAAPAAGSGYAFVQGFPTADAVRQASDDSISVARYRHIASGIRRSQPKAL